MKLRRRCKNCFESKNLCTPRVLKLKLGLEVSTSTIDRTLQEAGLFDRVALKKRAFDEEERMRLAFANAYKLTLEYLHNNGVTVLDFLPYSPDLNPIENLRHNTERRMEQRGAHTIDELQTAISEEWSDTPTELLHKLAHSMPQSCTDVIAMNGYHTRH
jgi:hypothetical protein